MPSATCRARSLAAARIAQREREHQPVAVGGSIGTSAQPGKRVGRQALYISYEVQMHIIADQVGSFALYRSTYQIHERLYLFGRTVPVLGRKCIQREIFDSQIR